VPVVSSTVGGLPELIVHGQTGYIAEIGDINRMARYAIELLSNPSKHEAFAQASRRRASEFEMGKMVGLYEQHYERILAGRPEEHPAGER
jgi:glycosyltransferase involved in cell wall biosynthesis